MSILLDNKENINTDVVKSKSVNYDISSVPTDVNKYAIGLIVLMLIMKLGVDPMSDKIEKKSELQKVLDEIMTDINMLKKRLDGLQNEGFPEWNKEQLSKLQERAKELETQKVDIIRNIYTHLSDYERSMTFGGAPPSVSPATLLKFFNKHQAFFIRKMSAENKGKLWSINDEMREIQKQESDFSIDSHTEAGANYYMNKRIEKWLEEKGKDPFDASKDVTNAQALKEIWNDLFGKGHEITDVKTGEIKFSGNLRDKLKDALENAGSDADKTSGFEMLKALDGKDFAGATGSWSEDGKSLLGFLNGEISNKDAAKIISKNLLSTWFNRTGNKPVDKSGETYDDTYGNVTRDFDSTKQTLQGQNSKTSAELSFDTQSLTSLLNISNKIIASAAEMKKTMTRNQRAG